MPSLLSRKRLLDALASAPPQASVVAPAGWGKSALLETAAASSLRLVPVALGSTEGHPALLVDALAQGLKRAYPGTAVGAVRAVAGLRSDEAPEAVLERTREALGVPVLTLGFDELERLPRGPVYDMLLRLVRARPERARFVFTSRQPLPPELGAAAASEVLGVRELALTWDEVEQLGASPDEARLERGAVRAVLSETGGWPALVSARLRASRAPGAPFSDLMPGLTPIVDEAIAHLKSEARYTLQIAAVVGRFERSLLQAIVAGEVAGAPEARRRLMRLEPVVVMRALDELMRSSLVVAGEGSALHCLVGLRGVLRARFRMQDQPGFLETHRRAAELLLASSGAQVGADLVDLFAASGERERLIEVLARHGSRLELELAANEQDARLLGWVEALEPGSTPHWGETLAGLALARSGDAERAKVRLERARDKLASERKETSVWRWQARIAEAQALTARSRGDYTDARSWLLRGLDQLAQTKQRGLAIAADEAEASTLELRMSIALARLCRESTGWDKTREAVTEALAMLGRERLAVTEPTAEELRRMLVAGAFAAGDAQALEPETERKTIDGIAQCARIALALLRDGSLARALDRLRQLALAGNEPLALLMLVRLLEPGKERDACIDDAIASGDAWVAQEATLRRGSEGGSLLPVPEGFSGAVYAEAQAAGPGRALEVARDAYRRVGARWEEARAWLVLGAAAARRVDDGDGELDAVLRPVDGLIEASQSAGFMIPWSFAGRGDADPERRVRTLLLAGLRAGQEKTKTVCRQELERLGIDTRVVLVPVERSKSVSPTQRRQLSASGAPFVQITRGGSQGISAADYQSIVASKSAAAFVVCVPDQVVLNFGRSVSLGQKRVMMPLLLHLLRNPDECFSMLQLAREVWDSPELTPTVQTKVKVAVSRLRALLGKSRNYIVTTRKMEAGESVVAYQTAPQLHFQIIEAVARE